MRTLNIKLLRDLRRLTGPAIAIGAVVACGIMAFISMRGAWLSLAASRDAFFERTRFADVVVPMVRAPLGVLREVAEVPGVVDAYARLAADAKVEVPGFQDIVRARLISIPDDRDPPLSLVLVRDGGTLPGRGEVLISEGFALAQGITPGAHLRVTLGGAVTRELVVSGVGVSPEAIYVVAPGVLWPDDERAAVMWLQRHELEGLLGMVGATNELLIKVEDGAAVEDVANALEERLRRFGVTGALTRKEQTSPRFIEEELRQLDTQTFLIPLIFLLVASFILHTVLSRLLATQRETIALLKAVGYSQVTIALHSVALAALIVAGGAVVGVAAGLAAGEAFLVLYRSFFRFDRLELVADPGLMVAAVLMASSAALLGAFQASWRAARLPPAVAMQPPTPAHYQHGVLDAGGVLQALPAAARMTLRRVLRRPLRAMMAAVGLGCSVGMLVVGQVMWDAMEVIMDLTFQQSMLEDMAILFSGERDTRALDELRRIPGVALVEGERMVAVRLASPVSGKEWEGAITARPGQGELRVDLDLQGRRLGGGAALAAGDAGLRLTDDLARRLDVRTGDTLTVERLDVPRSRRRATVLGMSQEFLGLRALVALEESGGLFGDGARVTGALLLVEPGSRERVLAELSRRPGVLAISRREEVLRMFQALIAQSMSVTRMVLLALAVIMAIGIVYNSARISLAEQARELATLRVLGFTRGEVGRVFLGGELLVLLPALPLGWALGRAGASLIMQFMSTTDLFRFPIVTRPSTYVFATVVVVAASAVTAAFMRRRLDHLDLVAVLKARE